MIVVLFLFFSSRRRHTRCSRDWSSDVCSSDLGDKWSTGISRCASAFERAPAPLRRFYMFCGRRVGLAGFCALRKPCHVPLQRTIAMVNMDMRSEEHTSELQSRLHLVCRLLLEKKKIL